MKATVIEHRFSDKNYPAFDKTFVLRYYVVGDCYMSYEFVSLMRVIVKGIIM